MTVDRSYVNRLTIQQLRRELVYSLEVQYGVLHAIRDVPEFPDPFILKHLGSSATYPEDFNRGKELQIKHGLDIIPPNHECEGGAGLWERIRSALTSGALKSKENA